MRHSLPLLSALLMLLAGPALAAVEQHYQENAIQIQKAGPFDDEKQVLVETGEKVTFALKIYQDEFFGYTTISANAKMTNTTDRKLRAVYSISFHDKDGKLIGCHQGSWEIDPGDDINYGSGIIYASPEDIASVSSYKLKTEVLESREDE